MLSARRQKGRIRIVYFHIRGLCKHYMVSRSRHILKLNVTRPLHAYAISNARFCAVPRRFHNDGADERFFDS